MQSQGSVAINAGRDIQLQTVATGQELDVRWNKDATRQSSTSQSVGTSISAQGNATLNAGRDIHAQGAQTYQKTASGMNYFSLQASSSEQSLNRTELGAKDVVIRSGGDTTLSATTVNAQTLDIEAGGKLALLAPKTQDSEQWNVTHGSSASVGVRGQGSSDEELNYNRFNVGKLTVDAKGGIQAQVGQDVNLNNLAQQPGMGWVSQITSDPNLTHSVEWQRVQEAHEQWAYHQSSMGPVSAALVAVMVAAAAAPAAGAAGTTAGNAAAVGVGEGVALGGGGVFLTGTGATISAVTAGAVQAGVLALSAQVGQSFFNNGGDLGKVFEELGDSESIRNLAAAVVTGGVLAGLGLVPTGQPEVAGAAKPWTSLLANNLQTQVASSLISSAINGTSLEDGLQQALMNALLNTVAANVVGGIGGLHDDGTLNAATHQMAHAIAGCALGAIKAGDGGGCAPGAIGAVVGEMMAEGIKGSPEMSALYSPQDAVYVAGLVGGLAAGVAGGDQQAIAVGNWAGANAAANNSMGQAARAVAKLCERFVALCIGAGSAAAMQTFVDQRVTELRAQYPGMSYDAAVTTATAEIQARALVNGVVNAAQTVQSWFASTPPSDTSSPGYAAGGVPSMPNNTTSPVQVTQGVQPLGGYAAGSRPDATWDSGYGSAETPEYGGPLVGVPGNGPLGGFIVLNAPDHPSFDPTRDPSVGGFSGSTPPTIGLINDVLAGSTNTTTGSGVPNATQPPSISRQRDFDYLTNGARVIRPTPDVAVGILADGTRVVSRPSTTGPLTIEIQRPDGKSVMEIRYGTR